MKQSLKVMMRFGSGLDLEELNYLKKEVVTELDYVWSFRTCSWSLHTAHIM